MPDTFDVIIVGSGPAGISAAFPLVQAGVKVLMVDGGSEQRQILPIGPYLSERYNNEDQWKWMVGSDYHSLKNMDAVSPKLRIPAYRYVFEDFIKKNQIEARDFVAVGSLARGGLSNAWGCGVARLSTNELSRYPFSESDIVHSYEIVSRRIGVSGAVDDDLSDYFGLDEWSQPPVPMDMLHQGMLSRYESAKTGLSKSGFRMGRSRVAVLSRDMGDRKACDILGNCLWGCHLKALYSSADEIPALAKYPNFHYKTGMVIDEVNHSSGSVRVKGTNGQNNSAFIAKKVLLAAGTLATTRLALHALKIDKDIRLQSCPTAAFLLWLPTKLGMRKTRSFGLGQLSYSLKLSEEVSAFGSTFSTAGIPVSEFVRHMPLSKRYGIDFLRELLGSCMVGNLFLPGYLSTTKVSLDSGGVLKINGGYDDSVDDLLSHAGQCLRKAYWKTGALLLPMSFTRTRPGSDIHYSSTLPMRLQPSPGETDPNGELEGLAGVHVVDGACLPELTEKSHTLTIMANADRIGRVLASELISTA